MPQLLGAGTWLATVATGVLVAAGCGADTATTAPAGSSMRSSSPAHGAPLPPTRSQPSALGVPSAPTATPAGPDVERVAAGYLAARENAISYTHSSFRGWLTEIRPVMTREGWARLSRSAGDSGDFPAATARAHRWSVRVTVACQDNTDAGPATNSQVTLTCALTDRTVDAAGNPVPAKMLPRLWPYNGPQPPALLAMRQIGSHWLVDADQSGQAG